MVKLSQQLERVAPTRVTRTERRIRVQEAKPKPVPQAPLPEGSLVKADVLKRLNEARAKERQLEIDRTEAFKKLQERAGNQNIGSSQRKQFNRIWNIKREQQSAKVRVLSNLNSKMTTNTFIPKTQLEGTLSSASSQAQIDFERSERADVRRVRVRKETKKIEATPTGVIDTAEFLRGLEETSTREVRRIEGGFSTITILEGIGFDKGRRVQVVRSKDTGEVRITILEGRGKGQVLEGRGLTSAEIQSTQLAELKERKRTRDPFLDIEGIKTDLPFKKLRTISSFVLTSPSKLVSFVFKGGKRVLAETPIPIFAGVVGGKSIKLRDLTSDPEVKRVINLGKDKTIQATKRLLQSTGGIFTVPVFTAGSGSIDLQVLPTTVKESKAELSAKLKEVSQTLFLADIKAKGIKKEFDPIFEAEFQARFEDKFGEEIIKGKITFEEAQKQFAKSDEAKLVAKRFGQVVEKKRAGKPSLRGAGIFALSLASLGIKLIPETKGGLLLETAVISGAFAGIGAVPISVTKIAFSSPVVTGFGLHGVGVAIDPKSSPEDIAKGVLQASISGGILALRGIKFLKTPTIKTKIIKAPKLLLKSSAVGREQVSLRVTSGGETKIVERVIFSDQKLSQISIAGRKTIVSTKFRDLLRLDPIFRGVPTAQRGTTLTLKSIRGDFVLKTLSAKQKAFNLLLKSDRAFLTVGKETRLISLKGFSGSQIDSILRFTAPKVIDVTLEKGILKIGGQRAVGQFTFRIDQPVITVDKALGIKTRGARSIRLVDDIVKEITKTGSIVTKIKETKMFLTKKGASFNVLRQAGKTQTTFLQKEVVKVGEIGRGFDRFELQILRDGQVTSRVLRDIPIRVQKLTSVSARQQIIPFKRKIIFGQEKTLLVKNTEKIVEIDLDKIRGLITRSRFAITPAKIIKTPLSKTFGADPTRALKIIIKKSIKSTPSSQVLDTTQVQINQALKSGITPTLNVKSQIKNLLKFDKTIAKISSLELGTLSALSVSNLMKTNLKTDLKLGQQLDIGLKSNLKTNQAIKQLLKQAQPQAQKTGQALKLSQVLRLTPSILSPTPVFKLPVIPEFKPPVAIVPIIPFAFPFTKRKKKLTAKEKKLRQELLFLPDFTARALGLDPVELTETQALKQIRKIQTGLEIRRGVKLLKGIPE